MPSRVARQDKTIVVPFASEEEYLSIFSTPERLRIHILEQYALHPELFPHGFEQGFHFCGGYSSKKLQGFSYRYIRLKATKETYQLHPPFVMPYLPARTFDVSKAMLLRRWGVPYWVLTEIFGHNDMFWHRLCVSVGRNSIVGTTAKNEQALPKHVNGDEKHLAYFGDKAFIATTSAYGCIFGAEIALAATEKELTQAYGVFAQEIKEIKPEHQIETVLTDGWEATQKAFKSLFSGIVVILCFLHAFLSIKKKCRREDRVHQEAKQRVWEVYRAADYKTFAQRIRRLRKWAADAMPESEAKKKVLGLCAKKAQFKGYYEHEGAYRTSNEIDRLMDYQDRLIYAMRGISALPDTLNLHVRASALLWNFHLFEPRTRKRKAALFPFEALNGFRYHDDWLHNLRIASSLKGKRPLHEIR